MLKSLHDMQQRLFDPYKVGLKFDIQDETDVIRNAAYTVVCEDCMHVVEGRNRTLCMVAVIMWLSACNKHSRRETQN